MADLTQEDVLKLAQLAKLNLTEEEVVKFQNELKGILGYVEQLSEVDIAGLEPTTQVNGLINVMRADTEHKYQSTQQDLLKNVPNRIGDNIKVRRVL